MEISNICKFLFFFSLFLFIYAYGGYSFLLHFITGLLKKKHKRIPGYHPKVSILIPVYNEERVIRQKIENCIKLDYPESLLQVMVCSDCSSDRTVEIAEKYSENQCVDIFEYKERSGKTGVINKSVPQAKGDIIIFTDANTMLKPDAVSKVVSMYSSEKIGAVLGQVILVVPEGGHGVQKEVLYRNFETQLKYTEGILGSTIGAFGGFYSIRKKLFTPLPSNAYSNDDLIIPTKIIEKGYKVLFDREAISIEDTGLSIEEEFGRRVRIGAGNFQSFFLLKSMLNPFIGIPFFLYFSHKVLRWFSPLIILSIFVTNAFLFYLYPYNVFFYLQVAFYGLAIIGALLSYMRIELPLIGSTYHFVSMNIALIFGFLKFVRGIKSAVWESSKRIN